MADDLKNSKTISKKDAGFPAYLDFDKLRSEGIEYLGKLAGQIWTDHNVHDPGITILEMLCYALLDLGYRTNLPAEDIFTRNPEDTTKDNNFFTPAQILACNPLTITDFRKLLIDIEEVRNAWLEPATDIKDLCSLDDQNYDAVGGVVNVEYDSFLNGLYHVYLDLEKDIDSFGKIDSDFERKEEADDYKEKVIDKVKKALMAHRNLCEDFEDIFILCKLRMGVCAEIELEENTEADKVYLALVEALRNFFTPSPRFYTLQQLLDKQKPIEEIFAGRPYDLTQSHGFVNTEEFEKIKLKKEIHLSDVYNVIFGVPGVRSVRNLSLRSCDGNLETGWKYPVKEHHVPEFSVRCSGFQFTKNGMPVSVDFKKYEGLFDLNFNHNGKVLYQSPSPYLDAAIPKGIYRNDLAQYYSIQNEFPRVYGIEEGGLPDNAPVLRKAQALQLKGYLLFFDQLLANYLTQLSNLRSLFALSSSEDEEKQQTYFINQLSTVPELQKLLRFQAGELDGNKSVGGQGSTLVFPVDKSKLLSLKENDQLKSLVLDDIKPYTFTSLEAKDVAVSQLKNDLYHETFTCELVTKNDDCVYYYILTCSEEIALISKKYFKDLSSAQENAASVKYIGTFDENYRSFIDSSQNFSFTVELNLASFAKYLQLLVENRNLYLQRRQNFLSHLLARFAEKFTDYALLSFGSFSNIQIEEAKIKATERFLTSYDDISSNRGKAYDYRANRWNNDNISGFEKRIKALIGTENWKRHSLCNFVVDEYDDQYVVTLKVGNQEFFTVQEKYDSKEEALQASHSLFSALSDRLSYQTQYIPHEKAYAIAIYQNHHAMATYREIYPTEAEAYSVIGHLQRLFSGNPAKAEDIFISQHIYFLQLLDHQGNVVRTSAKSYEEEAHAQSAADQLKQGVNDKKRWQAEEDKNTLSGTLYRIPQAADVSQFIDLDAFKIDINNTIVGKPDKFTYDVLDINNRFKFHPLKEFDNQKQAKEHWQNLLTWMTQPENYQIRPSTETGKYTLHIVVNGEEEAVCDANFNSDAEATQMQNEILSIIHEHLCSLSVQKVPHRWRFSYHLGIDVDRFSFESMDEYKNEEEALAAATAFGKNISSLQLKKIKKELRLVPQKPPEKISSVRLTQSYESSEEENVRNSISHWLSVQNDANQNLENPNVEYFTSSVALDALSQQGPYVYRLIDKDTVPAQYSQTFADRKSAEGEKKTLAKLNCSDYTYLEICFGGDIISKRKEESTGVTWYHFQIKARNRFYASGEEMVLFESAKGYQSEEDALKAFTENYLQILHWASDHANYGDKISTEEILMHVADPCIKSESIVFVPKETLHALGKYDEAAEKALAALANTFPIRLVEYQSETFYELFPCERKPEKQKEKKCTITEKKYVYYFRLPALASATHQNTHHWQSTKYYDTPEDARKDFRFFLMLLCYPGNFFVDCDTCHEESNCYRIYIREVLAESTQRFDRVEEAWGKEGVQKFICVSQTQKAFHNYQRKEDGCYSFYVACADSLVYHPCRYDTPQKRDEIINKLYQTASQQYKNKAYHAIQGKNGGYELTNENGRGFASVSIQRNEDNDQENTCEALVGFLGKAAQKQVNYAKDDNENIYVDDDAYHIEIKPYEGYEEEKWKKTLETFARYYPVVLKRNEKTGEDEYCIEVKLPGFNTAAEDAAEEKPCGCGEKEVKPGYDCYIAWKSRCCFTSCYEAENAWGIVFELLQQYDNYRPLFDCNCYEFGIALHYGNKGEERNPVNNGGFMLSDGEMVARNPQCYTHPEMVCAAVERAWKLINSEGLHVVEHILLRPRCEEDCQDCDQYNTRCENKTNCSFPYTEPNDDPCADQPDICFVPGADPYSFIATVALPAWPVRFRKPENRQLLENILYREAPAHVLLRVLWLAPHDFCCFESKYKKWSRWLARKKNCVEPFSVCDFLEFLFTRNYECLDDCEVCLPCEEDESEINPCFQEGNRQSANLYEYLNQINELYCWEKQNCDGYRFTACEGASVIEDDDDVVILSTQTTTATTTNKKQRGKTKNEPNEKPIGNLKSEKGKEVSEATAPIEEESILPLKPKPQLVNSRMTSYRTVVGQVLEKTKHHPLAEKAQVFLQDPQPSAERTSNLLTEITQNKKPKTGKALTNQQVFSLLQSTLCYYLDKVCFDGKDMEKISTLSQAIGKIRKAKIDTTAIYRFWDPDEVKRYEPDVDIAAIEQILSGTEKT